MKTLLAIVLVQKTLSFNCKYFWFSKLWKFAIFSIFNGCTQDLYYQNFIQTLYIYVLLNTNIYALR